MKIVILAMVSAALAITLPLLAAERTVTAMPYDLVGASAELVGDAVDDLLRGTDDELGSYGADILGAVRRGKLKTTQPSRLQQLALGIGVTSVAQTSTTIVTVTPQVPFRLERFATPTKALQVNDVKVGTNSQLVGAGSIPIELFAQDAVGVMLKGDTAIPGVDIALSVSNPGATAVSLVGAYFGMAAT